MKTELALLLIHDGPIVPASVVADLLRITERSLENKIYDKTCPVPMFKVGSKFAAHVSDVAAYIDSQRAQALKEMEAANGSATALLQQPRRAA